MAKNVVVIRYETDAPYSAQEIEFLKTNFRDFIVEEDGDADKGSVDIQAMTEERAKEERIKDITKFLVTGVVSAKVTISHPDYDDIEIDFTEEGVEL